MEERQKVRLFVGQLQFSALVAMFICICFLVVFTEHES